MQRDHDGLLRVTDLAPVVALQLAMLELVHDAFDGDFLAGDCSGMGYFLPVDRL